MTNSLCRLGTTVSVIAMIGTAAMAASDGDDISDEVITEQRAALAANTNGGRIWPASAA